MAPEGFDVDDYGDHAAPKVHPYPAADLPEANERIYRLAEQLETEREVAADLRVAIVTQADVVAPTQVRRPWRATLRTAVAAIAGVAGALPLIVDAVQAGANGVQLGAAGSAAVIYAAAVTRVMAIPVVNKWLTSIGAGAAPKVQ